MTARAAASTQRRSCPGRPSALVASAAAKHRRLQGTARLLVGVLVGGALAVALSSCFSAPPQIISLEPNRGSTSVPADSTVRVVFDRAVAHASVVGRFSVIATPTTAQTVSPAIPGCDFSTVFAAATTAPCWIHWLDPQPGFELIHQGAVFRPATRYTFTLAGGFADAQGDRNDLDHHWDLTTAAAPLVSASTPADRGSDVAVDTRLAVSFSAPMDAPSTAGAIALLPVVPGTRVVRNLNDHSRFVILPGQMLAPRTTYSISVGGSARGEDEQFVGLPTVVRFTTGARLESTHAVVLAGLAAEDPTQVMLPALAPAAPGEPSAAPVVLTAPRCALAIGCGAVASGTPLLTYTAAAVSPDGSHVAVVVRNVTARTSSLQVIDTIDGAVLEDLPAGTLPSWSPDGAQLAFATPTGVDLLDLRSGAVSAVAAQTSLVAPPLWVKTTTLVLSTAASATTPAAVELVNRQLQARYSLPGAPGASIAAAVSPGGARIALGTATGGVLVVPAPGAPGSAQTLAGHLQPLGFAGEGTLVAVNTSSAAAQLLRISVVGGDTTVVVLGAGTTDLSSVRVAPDGRRLVCLAVDAHGVRQAYVASADGSGELAMTRFLSGGLEARSVGFSD
ncbi:MAG: Ig-like domain-containing protein [Candidatus Dormibacteraeota bacterium]|uniref:Ig-like domain-containing protein n=1 Tax=Candidatus Aeolococcus gillhamiae TaxID=3127015 RepID=A0A934JTQ8_9BACT|nr:Ig-like domain-containing protein [Candidatus Dormibacteraeota bacterium]